MKPKKGGLSVWVLWASFVVGEKTHVDLSSSLGHTRVGVGMQRVKEWTDVRPARLRIPGCEELGGGGPPTPEDLFATFRKLMPALWLGDV